MRRVFTLARAEAPFLFGERGSLVLTRELRGVGGGGRDFGDGPEQRGLSLSGAYEGNKLGGQQLVACAGGGVDFKGVDLSGGAVARCQLRDSTWSKTEATGSSWDVVDLEGATIPELAGGGAHYSLVSFRDATLDACDFAGSTFALCDFSGATITGGSFAGAHLHGCDFEDAVLDGVDFADADLSSCSLRGAWLSSSKLEAARVTGADLRHAAMSAEQRKTLGAAGARVGGGWVARGWASVLGKGAPASHKTVRLATSLTWAAVAIAVPVLFFLRAVLNPVNPDLPPYYEEYAEEEDDEQPHEEE